MLVGLIKYCKRRLMVDQNDSMVIDESVYSAVMAWFLAFQHMPCKSWMLCVSACKEEDNPTVFHSYHHESSFAEVFSGAFASDPLRPHTFHLQLVSNILRSSGAARRIPMSEGIVVRVCPPYILCTIRQFLRDRFSIVVCHECIRRIDARRDT